jgi:hypothetical protein
VRLQAAFSPEIAGRSTTIRVRMQIAPTAELVPPPLILGQLHYPAGLDVQLSGLGIEACSLSTLEYIGPQGCPPDSRMGYGSAVAEAPIKGEVFYETAKIAILRAAEQSGRQALLICIYGETGVHVQIPLLAQLLPDGPPFGGLLHIQVPLVSTFPEGPDISVTQLSLVLGPRNLIYYEQVHHKRVAYKPAGIALPGRCPRGGFPFAVTMDFLDGSQASATTAVPCPPKARRKR